MTKRSPAATIQLKIRMKEPLRAKIEQEAGARGITMSAEIVRRLERSFQSEAARGGSDVVPLLDAVAAAMKATGEHAAFAATGKLHKAGRWLLQPFAFDQAAQAAARVLEGFRPPGEIVPPTPNIVEVVGGDEATAAADYRRTMRQLGKLFGEKVLREMKEGDQS